MPWKQKYHCNNPLHILSVSNIKQNYSIETNLISPETS